MKPDPARPEVALGVDVLAPEGYGEIIGGGQRVDDFDLLLQRIEEHKLPQEAFDWYLDLRRYGSVPHAGFGLGIERCVAWICGLEHVRETIPYPGCCTACIRRARLQPPNRQLQEPRPPTPNSQPSRSVSALWELGVGSALEVGGSQLGVDAGPRRTAL